MRSAILLVSLSLLASAVPLRFAEKHEGRAVIPDNIAGRRPLGSKRSRARTFGAGVNDDIILNRRSHLPEDEGASLDAKREVAKVLDTRASNARLAGGRFRRSLVFEETLRRRAAEDDRLRKRAAAIEADAQASQYGGQGGQGQGQGQQGQQGQSQGQGQSQQGGTQQGGSQPQQQQGGFGQAAGGLGQLAGSLEKQVGGLLKGLKERDLADAVAELQRSLDEAGAASHAHDARAGLGSTVTDEVDNLGQTLGNSVDDVTGALGVDVRERGEEFDEEDLLVRDDLDS